MEAFAVPDVLQIAAHARDSSSARDAAMQDAAPELAAAALQPSKASRGLQNQARQPAFHAPNGFVPAMQADKPALQPTSEHVVEKQAEVSARRSRFDIGPPANEHPVAAGTATPSVPPHASGQPLRRSRFDIGPPANHHSTASDTGTSDMPPLASGFTQSAKVQSQQQQQQQQQAQSAGRQAEHALLGLVGSGLSPTPESAPWHSSQSMLQASSPAISFQAPDPADQTCQPLQALRPVEPLISIAGLPPPVQLPSSVVAARSNPSSGPSSQVGKFSACHH